MTFVPPTGTEVPRGVYGNSGGRCALGAAETNLRGGVRRHLATEGRASGLGSFPCEFFLFSLAGYFNPMLKPPPMWHISPGHVLDV